MSYIGNADKLVRVVSRYYEAVEGMKHKGESLHDKVLEDIRKEMLDIARAMEEPEPIAEAKNFTYYPFVGGQLDDESGATLCVVRADVFSRMVRLGQDLGFG